MKVLKEINKVLQNHEKRIRVLEGFSSASSKKERASNSQSLNDHIVNLRDKKYFSQPKTAREVHTRLQSIYLCDLNRVEVALVRLSQKKQLRKTSKILNGKKVLAYVW